MVAAGGTRDGVSLLAGGFDRPLAAHARNRRSGGCHSPFLLVHGGGALRRGLVLDEDRGVVIPGLHHEVRVDVARVVVARKAGSGVVGGLRLVRGALQVQELELGVVESCHIIIKMSDSTQVSCWAYSRKRRASATPFCW